MVQKMHGNWQQQRPPPCHCISLVHGLGLSLSCLLSGLLQQPEKSPCLQHIPALICSTKYCQINLLKTLIWSCLFCMQNPYILGVCNFLSLAYLSLLICFLGWTYPTFGTWKEVNHCMHPCIHPGNTLDSTHRWFRSSHSSICHPRV